MGIEMFSWPPNVNYQIPYAMSSFINNGHMPLPEATEPKTDIQTSPIAPFELTAVAEPIALEELKERIKVKLVEEDLWIRFEKVQLEMIITKNGRNLFPKINFKVEGLEADNCYLFSLTFRRVGDEKYKFTKSEWVSAGHADEEFEQPPYCHNENARFPKGSEWMQSELSFAKLKLTNNQEGKIPKNTILLRSMHKYCPVLIIHRFDPDKAKFEKLVEKEIKLATFIAVTAYQNQNVTKLKINNNPFAKGFREGGRKRSHPAEPSSPAKINPNAMFSSFLNPLTGIPSWYPQNLPQNFNFTNYYNQAFQSQNFNFPAQYPMFNANFGFQ